MKLGVVLDHMPAVPGGAEAHTQALLLRAVEAGDSAALACMSGRAPDGVETILVRAKGGRPERDQMFARDGVAALRSGGCDVVLAIRHVPDCDVYLPHGGLIDEARAAKDRASSGVSWTTRVGRRFSRKHDWFRDVERGLLESEQGPLVIAVADGLRQRIVRHFPKCVHRIVTVINGVDATYFDPEPFAAQGAALRASWGFAERYVGLLLAHNVVLKGVEAVLESMTHEVTAGLDPQFVLVVAGGRLPRRLRKLVRARGLQDKIVEVGAVADARPLYAAADVLVHPTWYDPCSLVCLEALAMEVPVITTPINGVRDVMGQRGGIVIEQPGDPEAIAYALRVLHDPALRAVTADDARYLALRNRQTTRLDRILDLCRSVADGRAVV